MDVRTKSKSEAAPKCGEPPNPIPFIPPADDWHDASTWLSI